MIIEGGIPKPEREEEISDEMIEKLISDETTAPYRRAAEKKARSLSREEKFQLRALCKRDLFFLTNTILGYDRLSENLHGHMCKWHKETEHDRFREILIPRGHFKSTIFTIGHSIQVVLPYTEEDRQYDFDTSPLPWPYNLGTDCRLAISHETHESAARFLFAITTHVMTNPLLMALYPEIVPEKRVHRINKHELELPRSDEARAFPEPTIDTFGVGARAQGKHYNYIKLDDIFGDKARDSEAETETTNQWFDNIQSFFSLFSKDRFDLIGTRYSGDDVYAHAHEVYGDKLKRYIRKAEEWDPKTESFQPIFPEEFTTDSLAILKKNRKVYSAQYENDPDAEGRGLKNEWKRYFYWVDKTRIAIFQGDDRYKTIINIRDLDIVFLIDPGESKSGGFAVTGMDHRGRVFVLASLRLEMGPPDLTEFVFASVSRWMPRTVAIESDFFMNIFQFWWTREMSFRGIRFNITPVTTKKRAKDDRIMGLTPFMAAENFFINDQQKDLLDEWGRVGKSRNVHIFDALGYGPEVWMPATPAHIRAAQQQGNEGYERDDEGLDTDTGYSAIG